ncbi:hypothetical protein DUY81_01860 [Acidipropionibacterium acidipropionici]|nr:hypothetical protein DUY81_01860 [Acidipropionibacterium acidipropionici]
MMTKVIQVGSSAHLPPIVTRQKLYTDPAMNIVTARISQTGSTGSASRPSTGPMTRVIVSATPSDRAMSQPKSATRDMSLALTLVWMAPTNPRIVPPSAR